MTRRTMDWSDLETQPLPSLSTSSSTYTSRNLSELFVASQDSLRGTATAPVAADATAWQQPWGSSTTTTMTAPTTPRSGLPVWERIEDQLARREQEILDTILTETAAMTRAKTQALIEAQLEQLQQADQQKWMQELIGTRNLGTTTSAVVPLTAVSPNILLPDRQARIPGAHAGSSLPMLPPAVPPSSLDPTLVQAHLQAVQRMKHQSPQQSLAHLRQALSSEKAPMPGYRAALQWMEHVLLHGNHAMGHMQATLTHFCTQFQQLVIHRVRQATLAGQDVSAGRLYQNEMAGRAAAFCQLTMHHSAAGKSVWPVIYTCLRCGDAVAALDVYQSMRDSLEPAVHRLLQALASVQGTEACLWSRRQAVRLPLGDRRAVFDALESLQNRMGQLDLHLIGTYALLSGMAPLPTSETTLGFTSIEDYLTGALWKAVLQENPLDALKELGQQMQGLESHLADAESGGWSFALSLLATQRYEKALLYLANQGGPTGLLQAVHVGLLLSSAGVDVADFGEETSTSGPSPVVATLLVAYSNQLLLGDSNFGSAAALEYLVRIPNASRARKEIARLIAKTGDVERLAGKVTADGVRESETLLDKYLRPPEISTVLEETATLLLQKKDRTSTGSAALCLMLAGRYGDVLSLLNDLLSPPDKPDEDRAYWMREVESFHASFLDKPTQIKTVLGSSPSLVRSNRLMVQLNHFFAELRNRQFEKAWSIVERLGLLPQKQTDMSSAETGYRNLGVFVQQAYPALLTGCMEILRQEHARLKASGNPVARQRLDQLQQQARLLVTLAGMVGVVGEPIQRLARLESLMI